MYTVEDVELQFTAVLTDAVPSLLQYSLDDGCSTPAAVLFWAYVHLVPTYVVPMDTYMVRT